jgi:hypothetical protein
MKPDESNDFLTKHLTSAPAGSPGQDPETISQIVDLKARRMGENSPLQAVSEKSEESEFVAFTRLLHKFCQGEKDWWIRQTEALGDILKTHVPEHFQHRVLKIHDLDPVPAEIPAEVNGDTFGYVLSEPPAVIPGVFRSIAKRGDDPLFVKNRVPSVGQHNEGHTVE